MLTLDAGQLRSAVFRRAQAESLDIRLLHDDTCDRAIVHT